jgi:hypothetical protein
MRLVLTTLALLFVTTLLPAQTPSPFTGTWKLNSSKSNLETPTPPTTSTVHITFNETHWHYERTHEYSARKPEIFSIDLDLNASQPHVEKDGPFTFASRLTREGATLVLHEVITASNGQKATNTIRYTLTNNAQTLTELEHKQTPSHEETNRWVFDRIPSH